jgi:hypothetical protein
MKVRQHLAAFVRGWLPKEPKTAYMHKPSKSSWKPYWKVISIAAVLIVLSSVAFVGVRTYLRYIDPKADVTASYFEKTVNNTTVEVGDVVEVEVLVGWHGYVIPEFKRDVKIVDPIPESNFALASESNVYESTGYGGSYLIKYSLKVVGGEGVSTELPEPKLCLDNVEIPLKGTSPIIDILSK